MTEIREKMLTDRDLSLSKSIRFVGLLNALVFIASLFSVVLGLCVLIGWHTRITTLIQVFPDLVPMQYNTAVGFILCGMALLFAKLGRRRLAIAAGLAAVVIGTLTFGEYVFSVNLGIDELLKEHYIMVETSHPGRMAPNTAICFVLIGLIPLLGTMDRRWPYYSAVSIILASLAFGLATVALSGYLMGIETAYGWGQLTRMAIHTALGFMVLSVGTIAMAWRLEMSHNNILPRWLPIPICVGVLTMTVCFWQSFEAENRLARTEGMALHSHSFIADILLVVGIILAVTLAFAVKQAQKALWRAREIEKANRSMADEINKRKEAQKSLQQAQIELEDRVKIRTSELSSANAELEEEIIERKIAELQRERMSLAMGSALKLNQYIQTSTIEEITQRCLDEGQKITNSKIGFFHFVNPDQETIQLKTWSKETRKTCEVPSHLDMHYSVSQAGVWVDCIRQRKPIIHNDYASLPNKKGLPEGHVPLIREAVVPIFEREEVVAVIGVGNKEQDYDQTDIHQLTLLAENTWFAIKRKRIEKEREILFEKLSEKTNELELAGKYKSEFMANMSHELRSPLSSILLLSRDLAANEEGNLTEEQIEIAEIVHSSGNGLLTLINDILDLSKVEAGKMTLNPENVHLADIAGSMQRSFGRMVKQKGLELSINVDPGTPPTVHTDRLRVEQVIKNLMANAIKFTSSGKITMDIYKPQKDVDLSLSKLDHDKAVAVSVTDTGIGIPPDRLEHIFEVFNQAENSTSHKFGGTGLGLSISRELAKLLGGEIQLESEVDKGSKFTFYFNTELTGAGSDEPLLEESARVSHRQVENLSEQKKETITKLHDIENMIIDEKILLVDDDMRNVYALSKLLTGKGANVLKAANGADALKILDENQDIDIVLMDIMMPVMDGYEATRKIRSQKQFAHLPIIALTAKVMPEDRDKCIEAGCSDYLAKPVDFDQLLSLMINWLKHKITS